MSSRLQFVFAVFFLLLFIPSTSLVMASHGGGGCSGDCVPPTLGQDNDGRVYVDEGLSINDKGFQVSSFKQDMPTQILKVGESATIQVKVYENTGPHYLSYVGLFLKQEEQTINGIRVASHPVQIIWEQTFEGDTSVELVDPNEFVSNVNVNHILTADAFGNDDKLYLISFEFTPTKPFDVSVMTVKMWD